MNRSLSRIMLWVVEVLTRQLVSRAERTTDPVLLELLADHPNAEIDTAVSMNPAADPDTLSRLLNRARMLAGSDEEWREHIVRNPALPAQTLREIMRDDPSEAVRVRAACTLSERLTSDPKPDLPLIMECLDFLVEIDARVDYAGVKPALSILRPMASRVGGCS